MTFGDSRPTPEAGQGGQNYLASVSDLVSALIFVFIIMLAVFAYQLASVTSDLVSSHETRDRILRDIAVRLEESGMRVKVVSDQGVLRLSDNAINFPLGKKTPNNAHLPNVGRLAQAIAEVVPCYVADERPAQSMAARNNATRNDAAIESTPPGYCRPPATPESYDCRESGLRWRLETLLIEGHTDNIPVSSDSPIEDNLELSSMRAATVYRMIRSCEPRVEYLLNTDGHQVLSTSGYGYSRPATSDESRMNENRRIDLRFLMEPPQGGSRDEPQVQADVRDRVGETQQ